MTKHHSIYILLIFLLGLITTSCDSSKDNYTAYFGGEIINPKDKWVVFYKEDEVIDSIQIDENNKFFKKFESLKPGLYRFKHNQEFQFVYFDKNDSILARLNTHNFDESLVFCGRGEEKNNFLIESYLKNLKIREESFKNNDLNEKDFLLKADSLFAEMSKFYIEKKEHILWNEDFDVIAKASISYPDYSRREFYPIAHKRRNPDDSTFNVNKDYYKYRENINYNDEKLQDFYPYLRFIHTTVENISNTNNSKFEYDAKTTLRSLNVLDSLTSNQTIKNKISNSIALSFLMEKEQNAFETKVFNKFNSISTDTDKKEEIASLIKAIKQISDSKKLPELSFVNAKSEKILSTDVLKKKTLIYFWSSEMENHFYSIHQKINTLIQANPNLNFVAVSLDKDHDRWVKFINKNKSFLNPKITLVRAQNLIALKNNWAVVKANKAFVVNQNSDITKGFINLFNNSELNELKSL